MSGTSECGVLNTTFHCRLDDGFDKWAPFTPAPANGPVGAYQFTPNQTYALYPQLANVTTILLPVNQVSAELCCYLNAAVQLI